MIWTLPNCLTIARIVAAPVVGIMVAAGGRDIAIWAFVLFVLASLTDFLDGWVARRLNQVSAVGKMLDPIADKAMVILVLAALASLATGATLSFIIPTMLILLREVLVSGLREFLGDIKLPVTYLAKWKTTVQMVAIGALLLVVPMSETEATDAAYAVYILGTGLLWLAALLTIVTGWDYFRKGIAHIRMQEG
ncbi:CDP-diacylglycerol--glycerol-3-phosphate 3-phosphatidyltransferase [Rhodobacteraceae bacterium NNCM2]|nr:CDP-diacylglycerol--glycerol-3-phosphate 3-phosphatidyltransferase [Coraliihabitans acroporae]